ncbi:hypothetical protein BpHYR1_034794 [Brachionus plicatilis]|uniref:Uncharacterized protein n=1 Tax=Brachionus plicatilis TaxID=10195 RepID=A0A3M7SQZ9_BRAPC|nr:hypothetical protein BpHYR1_034794 [Brachionus plicatilis]
MEKQPEQPGFRRNGRTVDNLFFLNLKVSECFMLKKSVCSVLLDITVTSHKEICNLASSLCGLYLLIDEIRVIDKIFIMMKSKFL